MKHFSIPFNNQEHRLALSLVEPSVLSEKVAIIVPGYLETMNYPHITSLQKMLGENGYTAVSFDPLGTWKSSGDEVFVTVTNYLKAIGEIISYLQETQNVTYVLLAGHSMGAYTSLLYSQQHKNINACVAIMPPSSMARINERTINWKDNGVRTSIRLHPETKERITFNVPYSSFEDAQNYDLKEYVSDNNQTNTLIIASKNDTICDYSEAKRIISLIPEPKTYKLLHEPGHNYQTNADHILLINRTIQEWDQAVERKVTVVDNNDKVIGYKKRAELEPNDIYRVAALWITDKDGSILLAQRAHTKNHHPELFGPAVAGTAEQGEDYEYNIRKEAQEELGLTNLEINHHKTYFSGGDYKHFTALFSAVISKERTLVLQADEVQSVRWFSLSELEHEIANNPGKFLPSFVKLFGYFNK